MSGKRFQSRAKTVQKLGRDGLVEQNMATGEEKRVSQRTADVSFGPARPQEQAAGHRAVQRSGGDSVSPGKKQRPMPPRPPPASRKPPCRTLRPCGWRRTRP